MKEDYTFDEIIEELRSRAKPGNLEGMARFGIKGDKRLGISIPELREMGKSIGKDHKIALNLWATKIPDAMILAALIDEPGKVTEQQTESWVKDLNSWDVCDQLCMNLFNRVPFVEKKIKEWSKRDEEFIKRASFVLIACIARYDKKAPDEMLTGFFPVIKSGAADERNYVKKAVSWALRHIGKKNLNLNKKAIELAREIKNIGSKPSRWIASDVIRELESEAVKKRLKNKKVQ
ncbi:MAG: DNA alkylation repair protein [Actinomycetia bacterium]|nr:DNA alkylation repair protein [Actinomycetes bacterium]